GLGDFLGQHRLAGAGLALDQQRPLQGDGGVDRELEVIVRDVGAGALEFHRPALTLPARGLVNMPVHSRSRSMKPIRPLVAAIIVALPAASQAETALTVYSSARPGTLSPQNFRSGGEGQSVPGYALVRDDRTF